MSKSILIFDDDENILTVCTQILQLKGWTVHSSADVKNLLEKIAAADPDVILMDNWIPDIDGIAATRVIKSSPAFRHIPVIYFTANRDIRLLAETAGADVFLAKPFDISELVRVADTAYREVLKKVKDGAAR